MVYLIIIESSKKDEIYSLLLKLNINYKQSIKSLQTILYVNKHNGNVLNEVTVIDVSY